MRIRQLHEYLGYLINSGIDADMPVCIADSECKLPIELSRISVAEGPFLEDPYPKLCASLSANGKFLVLIDVDASIENLDIRHELMDSDVQVPEKEWD